MDSQTESPKPILGMDGIILGYLLGSILIYWAGGAYLRHEHILHTPVTETLWVAVYLTAVVAYCGLRMPVFTHRSPFWSTFWLIVFSGHISLLFDSFAVVLLLASGIIFLPLEHTNSRFNQFVVKVTAAFAALTVGGGFYLGELWGLPYYITNNLDVWNAGFPLLLVLTPYSIILATIVAWMYPVKMEPVEMDSEQLQAGIEFTVALTLIIVTHSPLLCIGILLLYTALRRKTLHLVDKFAHEIKDGAQNALGLILLAVIVQSAGLAPLIQPLLDGFGLFVGAFISSPFAGAMAPPAESLQDFYENLSLIMLGAPVFVFSSLVAIVVFTDTLDYEDLPRGLLASISWIPGIRGKNQVQEGLLYTVLIIPMLAGLALCLYLANDAQLFTAAADALGVTFDPAVLSAPTEQ